MLVGADLKRPFAAAVAAFAALVGTAIAVGAPSTASASGFSCSSGGAHYTVRSGEGWFVIADRVDVSASALLDANDADLGDLLLTGDRLCLPAGADVAAACDRSYTVRSGDGWFSIAARVGVSASSLLAANGADLGRTIHAGEVLCLPAGASPGAGGAASGAQRGSGTYQVVRGDSWFGIAERAGVSGRALLAVNDATTGTLLVPGDVVRLPAGAEQPAPRSASGSGWVDLEALPTQGPCGYADTWAHARGRGRRHAGTDIFSGRGNYVYAVVDGRLSSRGWDQPGGISGNAWMLTGDDGNKYFYAHLADFAPEVRVGSRVRAGQIIGWVGSTGNASGPHLHFEIRPGGGSPINPYPILRAHGGCNKDTPYTQPGGWVPDRRR